MPVAYKNHTIVAGAAQSTQNGLYLPVVHIAWNFSSTNRGEHSIVPPERFPTFEEASAAAYQLAKTWVDNHAADTD
jgi:hypothetical protein